MIFIHVEDIPSSKEFNRHVEKKPTFVQFYSPQCGHCQSLEPKWDQMTEILEKDYEGDMMVARVRNDLMENVNCDKKIEGFPTMFVLEKGKKKGEHKGARETVDLVKFVEDNFPIRKKGQRGGRRRKTRRRKTRRRKTRRRKTRRRKTRRRRRFRKRANRRRKR